MRLKVSLARGRRKTGPGYTAYKGVVAFCGNNQQVVAKQGYECIRSAVNTVARRVRRLFLFWLRTLPQRTPLLCPAAVPGEGSAGARERAERRRTEERRSSARRYIRSTSPHGGGESSSSFYCLPDTPRRSAFGISSLVLPRILAGSARGNSRLLVRQDLSQDRSPLRSPS